MTASVTNYDDDAKLEYGRLLWRLPEMRARLLHHWTHPSHPHAERFVQWRSEVERLLESSPDEEANLDAELRQRGLSLRVVVREIPSVFGSFF
jgi:hypothetical protein